VVVGQRGVLSLALAVAPVVSLAVGSYRFVNADL